MKREMPSRGIAELMRRSVISELATLSVVAIASLSFISLGGYFAWMTGFVLLYLIQGYVAWFLFSRCNQPFYGYAVTMAIGAYGTIVPSEVYGWPVLAAVPLGALLGAITAASLFVFTSRARGFYVGMVSFLLTILFPSLVEALRDITGGRSGLSFHNGLAKVVGQEGLLYLVLAAALITITLLFLLMRTKIGQIFVVIAENESLAKSIGINTFPYKLLAYSIAGGLSGLGGSLYVNYLGAISSIDLNVLTTLYITFIPIVGGSSVPFGPILGTLVIQLVPEALASVERYLDLIFGATFILVVLGLRDGIGGAMALGIEKAAPRMKQGARRLASLVWRNVPV